MDRESDLSPLDLTLGWESMSDTATLSQFRMWRGRRCYYWQPLTEEAARRASEAASQSANVHLIPASAQIGESLLDLKRGNVVEMGGFLVEVTAPDGWRWRSSLSRADGGLGACEVMWVEWVRLG
jgi:hypothetical protein